jgi:hypothetical protein
MRNASIDLEAAGELGVVVCGTASRGAPTAELTWALILGLTRRVAEEDRAIRAGGWQHTIGPELAGRTLGVIGLGRLGARVARIAHAFEMDVLAWSQNLDPARAASVGVRAVARDELLRRSDVVTIHLRLSERTRGLQSGRSSARRASKRERSSRRSRTGRSRAPRSTSTTPSRWPPTTRCGARRTPCSRPTSGTSRPAATRSTTATRSRTSQRSCGVSP